MKVILFDMMNTLVREPYSSVLDHLLRNAELKEAFFKWKNRKTAHDFERGEIPERIYFQNFYLKGLPQELSRKLPKPAKIKKALFQKPDYMAGMADLLSELQADPRVLTGVASNYSEWYEVILEKLPVLKECDFLFFSCEMGSRKPERFYYQMIDQALQAFLEEKNRTGSLYSSREVLFTDDRQVNIDGAEGVGWQGHLMQNAYDVRKAIEAFLR